MNRLQGIHFHDPKKLTAELRGSSWWFSLVPLPPQIEYAILAAQSRKLMAEPDQEKLAKESMTAALTLVKATAQGDSVAEAEQVFSRADPATKTAMFLKAVQTQMKERVWPSAFLLYVAYTPGNMPPAFIARLAPGGGQGWEAESIPERSELSLRAIRNLLEKLEAALPDDSGPVAMAELVRLLNLGTSGFTGPGAIRRVFGPEAAEVHGNAVTEDRYIRAAGIFHTLWLVEMAVYY
jgi:hypothetical protein